MTITADDVLARYAPSRERDLLELLMQSKLAFVEIMPDSALAPGVARMGAETERRHTGGE